MNGSDRAAGLRARACHPNIVMAPGALARMLHDHEPYLLLSQPAPLRACDPAIAERAAAVMAVGSLAAIDLEAMLRDLADAPTVVGLGGGMTMDAAKFVAWQRGLRLVLAPTVVSVDACVTNTIAVRAEGSVEYRGFVVADAIVLDTDVIRAAPSRLNRAGVGDLVSIHTALHDWSVAVAAGRALWSPDVAARAAAALDQAESLASEIGAVTPLAIESVVRLYASVNALLLEVGHSLPEEGSEHYFAYHVEALTGRSFVHGELVGLGTVLLATLQHNAPERPRAILDAARVEWRPGQLGLDTDTLLSALEGLRSFARAHDLPWSIADELDLSMTAATAVQSVL